MDNNPNAKTSIGMDGNVAALLSYLVGIIGLIVLITEKENKFAKFHALQAFLFHLSFGIIVIFALILFFVFAAIGTVAAAALGSAGAIIGFIFYIVGIIIWFAAIILGPLTIIGGSIYGAIQAYNGRWFKIPLVGNLTAKILGINV